jgi:hypothetical protein
MMLKPRRNVFITGVAVASVAGAIWTMAAVGRGPDIPVSALGGSGATRGASPDTRNLADAVDRWQAESARLNRDGPGKPVIERATPLLTHVGRERDTLTAFPTTNGAVCFEIKAAGTCGKLDTPTSFTWAILSTRGSTRVFGVAADDVRRIEVDVDGVLHRALLRSNGYFYELDEGLSESAIRSITSTSKDGATRKVELAR